MPRGLKTEAGPVKLTAEVGKSGLNRYGGYVHEEFDPDLRSLRGIKVYDEMRRADASVAAGLRLIKWVIGSVEWRVEPGGESAADKKAAEFLTSCLDDMKEPFSRLIRDALTMLEFGFAWLEWVMKVRNGPEANPPSRYDDGKIGWSRWVLCGQSSWLRWEFDDTTGDVKAFVQIVPWYTPPHSVGSPEIVVPIEKSVLFRLEDEKDNPEGISLLRPVYNPWYFKKQLQEIEAIGAERDLTGVLIIRMPANANASDMEQAKELLEQFKADDMSGFVAPCFGPGEHERWTFEIIASPGEKSIDTDKVINRYQQEIARAFLAQFLMLGSGDAGSWALSRDQSSLFEVALGAILRNLEETLNRKGVPPLFRFNDFGKLTKLPELHHGPVAKRNLDAFAKALGLLVQSGFLTPGPELEEMVRQEYELPDKPKPTPEEEEIAKLKKQQEMERLKNPPPPGAPAAAPDGQPQPAPGAKGQPPKGQPAEETGTGEGAGGKEAKVKAQAKPEPPARQASEFDLATWEQAHRDDPKEWAVVVRGGECLMEKSSESGGIRFTFAELGELAGSTLTHNHAAAGLEYHNPAFSDVEMAARGRLRELRTVSNWGRVYLRRADGADFDLDYHANTFASKAAAVSGEVEAEFKEAIDRGQLTAVRARESYWDTVWERLAPQVGIARTVEPW